MIPGDMAETMPKYQKRLFISAGVMIPLLAIASFLLTAPRLLHSQEKAQRPASDAKEARGIQAQAVFEGACASCHGLDARGGERGPNIASRPDVVHKTDGELFKILRDGKVAEGMPSFAAYGPAKLSALVSYLRTLQGRTKEAEGPGDPAKGKVLFFGKAKCAECHMVSGQGGFFARDLTAYAAGMDAKRVLAAIADPNKDLDLRRGLVTITFADSTALSGMARNEDNFSLQLQTPDGAFHLINKAEIRATTYTGRSPMPSDYVSTLSPAELNDLVSYLFHTSRSEQTRRAGSKTEDKDEE